MTTFVDCDFAGTVGATVSSPYSSVGFDASPGDTTFETSTVSGKGTAAKTVNGIAGTVNWRVDTGGVDTVYFDFLWNHETADAFSLVEVCDTGDGFVIGALRVNSSGQFLLRSGDEWTGAGSTDDTSAVTYTAGNWVRIQASFNRTSGATEAKIYLSPLSASPDETLTGTIATTDAIGWVTVGTGGAPGDTYLGTAWLDDAWISDTAYRAAAASFSGVTGAIVEIALASNPFDTTPVWTDVTGYVDALNYPISIERGRADSFEAATPGVCTFVLNNDDKRFTPGYTAGPYGSTVKIGKRVRVTIPHNGTDYRRFVGFISSFDMGWPTGVTQQNRVQVTCVDLLGMMEQVKLRNVVTHTYVASDPVALWPLDDRRGSGGAMEISGVRQPRLKKIDRAGGGSARFAGGDGLRAFPDGKKDRAVRFKSDPDESSWTALGKAGISLESATTTVGFGGWVNFDGDQDFGELGGALASVKLTDVTSGDGAFVIGVTSKGKVYAQIVDNSFLAATAPPLATGRRITGGSWHHVYATYTETGNGVVKLYVDGVEAATSAAYGAGYPTIPATTTVTIGAARSVDDTKYEYSPTNARFAYWGIWTDDTAVDLAVDELYEAGWRAWQSKDRTSTRVQRVLVWMGTPSNMRSIERGLSEVDIGDMKGMSALEYVNQVVAGEQGFFFIAGDGTATFHARDHRYDGTPECTLSWHQPDETFTTDLEQIINTVTVTHNKDGEVRVQDNDSRATYGPRELELDAALTDANQAQAIGDYVLKLRETLTPRLSQFTYDLLTEDTESVRDDVLGLELGDLFTIGSLPTQAHVSSFDVWIEGIRETIGVDEWRTTFITTPDKGLGGYWTLGTTAFDDPPALAY